MLVYIDAYTYNTYTADRYDMKWGILGESLDDISYTDGLARNVQCALLKLMGDLAALSLRIF